MGLIAISLFVVGAVLYVNNSDASTVSGVADVKTAVSKHYLLPSDEEPAVATVTDKSKVQSKFFKDAKNGDRVLIYQRNQLAIIYRPSIDRIITIGPVDIDTPKNGAE